MCTAMLLFGGQLKGKMMRRLRNLQKKVAMRKKVIQSVQVHVARKGKACSPECACLKLYSRLKDSAYL